MLKKYFLIPPILLLATFIFLAGCSRSGSEGGKASEKKSKLYKESEEKSLAWLQGQIVPNEIVSEPIPDRRRLILSYELPKDDPAYPFIFSRSSIYDDAIAAIALTMNGDMENAGLILSALSRLVHQNGRLWFVYNTANSWPTEGDSETALFRSGAIAWVGYAMTFYLMRGLKGDPDFLLEDRRAKSLLETALSIGDYLTSLQVREVGDRRTGLITGGEGTIAIKLVDGQIVDQYRGGMMTWTSIEHNIDSYFFLRDLARVSRQEKYKEAAGMIKDSLLKVAWSPADGQYYRGVREEGIDTVLALDGASWGAIFSLAVGEKAKAERSLEAIEKNFRSSDKVDGQVVQGYKPYTGLAIYEDRAVNRFVFPDTPDLTWTEFEAVWGEGSLGVAMAYLKLGRTSEAEKIVDEMIKLQGEKGGVLYLTKEIPHEFINVPSVASTAWLVMVLSAMRDKDALEDFWGK